MAAPPKIISANLIFCLDGFCNPTFAFTGGFLRATGVDIGGCETTLAAGGDGGVVTG